MGWTGEDCAWCFDPAVETALVMVRGDQREVDLCDRHLQEVLTGARPIHDAAPPLPDPH